MDVKQRINKFNTENRPFYIVDHENGEYSLYLALSFLEGEYEDFGQEAFNRYAILLSVLVLMGMPSSCSFATRSMLRRCFCSRRRRMLQPMMGEPPCLIRSVLFIRRLLRG
ncbi:MAG: hypothetical protein HDQ95_08150 [Roseburia sp.]|nr:hypothetical protein [Roseburia sp.]